MEGQVEVDRRGRGGEMKRKKDEVDRKKNKQIKYS